MTKYYEKYKKGFLELFFLKILSEEDLYGYELADLVNHLSGKVISISAGNMYPVLYKLEERGYIKSYEKIVGKRMKRVYYHLTEEGQEELQKMMADYEKFENAANAIINFRRGQSEKSGQITEPGWDSGVCPDLDAVVDQSQSYSKEETADNRPCRLLQLAEDRCIFQLLIEIGAYRISNAGHGYSTSESAKSRQQTGDDISIGPISQKISGSCKDFA